MKSKTLDLEEVVSEDQESQEEVKEAEEMAKEAAEMAKEAAEVDFSKIHLKELSE